MSPSTLPTHGGWHEAVLCVRDLSRWCAALETLFGWQVTAQGAVDPRLLAVWRLPSAAQGREAVLVHPDDPPRSARLVQLAGVEQVEIRSGGNHWDTGGFFSLLCYARDVDATFRAAQSLGWSVYHDPVDMHFEGRVLRNVVLRAWDGVAFGLYTLRHPEPPPPRYASVAMAFNGQQSVREIGAARAFYRDVLGWQPWFDGVMRLACNNFGMPENFVGRTPQKVVIAAGGRDADGSLVYGQVELVEWVEFRGQDFAARARPPNLGIVALRVPVPDAPARARELRQQGVRLLSEPALVELAPYGEVTLFGVQTPDGALLEFFARL
jgi:catechol 2,3-dioxygenase-like lactoylglutathione lyase family enzyme